MPPKYNLRECEMDDLEAVLRIENVSFPDPYDRRTFEYFILSEPAGFLVAEIEESLAGYVVSSTMGGHGLIVSIAVAPEHKREGIGTGLIQAALRHLARSVDEVYLQVSVNNPGAIDFYRKLSFRETGLIKNYYPNGDDACVMVLRNTKSRDGRGTPGGPGRSAAGGKERTSRPSFSRYRPVSPAINDKTTIRDA